MNYEPNDKVFLFGFSRVAFTVRSLAGLIGRCGLMDRGIFMAANSERARAVLLRRVVNAYRSTKTIFDDPEETAQCKERRIRDELGLSELKPRSIPIHFIGVWGTVDAVGMPFEELKHVIGYFWARVSGRRLWHFNDQIPHHRIRHAYHALALDDERRTFHPILWELPTSVDPNDESETSSQPARGPTTSTKVKQVWFAGMHANVGGGYPRDELAHVSLNWMIDNAERHGLIFLAHRRKELLQAADVHGHMYNSRTGLRMFYRPGLRDPYRRRKNLPLEASWSTVLVHARDYLFADRQRQIVRRRPTKPVVHESVYARARRVSNGYAPKALVASPTEPYARADKDGLPLPAVKRLQQLDLIHQKVHCLFVTLAVVVLIWAMPFQTQLKSPIGPLFHWWKELKSHVIPAGTVDRLDEFSASVVELVDKFTPAVVPSVLGVVTSNPVEAVLLLVALAVVWKANRLVDVETRHFAFKCWYWIGDGSDVDRRLKRIEEMVNWKTVEVGRVLFALLVFAIAATITIEFLMGIPREIVGALMLLVVAVRAVGVFER